MRILSIGSNLPLGNSLASLLKTAPIPIHSMRFSDGEFYTQINATVRGETVYIVHSMGPDPDSRILELLLTADALRNSSAEKIIAVLPYFPYARQDRRTNARSPISARAIARILEKQWIDHVLTVDLHTAQLQGFFGIPVDNLFSIPLLAKGVSQHLKNPVVLSPDIGGVARSRVMAKLLKSPLAIVDKRRDRPGISEVVHVLGNVKGADIVMLDDIVDSAITVCNAAQVVMDMGANSVIVCASHGLFTGQAIERILASPLKMLIVTDSLPQRKEVMACKKITQLSLAPTLAEAISRMERGESLSTWTEP